MPLSLNIAPNITPIAGGVDTSVQQSGNSVQKAIQFRGFQSATASQTQINSFFGQLFNSTLKKTNKLNSSPLVLDFRKIAVNIPTSGTKLDNPNAANLSNLFRKQTNA